MKKLYLLYVIILGIILNAHALVFSNKFYNIISCAILVQNTCSYFLETHNTLSTADFRTILGNIFSVNGSVNFYMFHGGTNFGYMNGANILGKGPVPSCHEYFTLKGTIRQDFLIFMGGWFMWRHCKAMVCTEHSCNPTVTPKRFSSTPVPFPTHFYQLLCTRNAILIILISFQVGLK